MKALRFVLLAIAFAVVAGLGLRVLHPGWVPPTWTQRAAAPKPPPAPEDPREAVLSRLTDAPDYTPFFDKLRSAFPSDYMELIKDTSAAVAKGGRVPNPDRLLTDAMRHLRQSRGVQAAQAEAGPLASMFAAQAMLVDLLAGNPGLCTDFMYGGSSPDFMAFAAKHREAVARLAIASLDATLSGKTSHVERGDPTPEDFDLLAADLQTQGLSDDEIAAVLDGKTFDPPLSDARLCAAGRTYLHAIERLPEETRLRVYAFSAALLARS